MALTSNVDPLSQVSGPLLQQRSLAYFTDLNPADNNKFIEARVYRKWTTVKMPSLLPTCFSCILLDKKVSYLFYNSRPFNIALQKTLCLNKLNIIFLIVGVSYTSKCRFKRKRTVWPGSADKLCIQNTRFRIWKDSRLGEDTWQWHDPLFWQTYTNWLLTRQRLSVSLL